MNIPEYEHDLYEDAWKIIKQYPQYFQTVVDIGSRVGYFSVFAAKQSDKVFAIEPVEGNYWNLVENIFAENLTEKIFPIHTAIWHDRNYVEIGHILGGNSGQYLVFPGSRENKIMVKAISFPKLVRMIGKPIDYLKVDIEAGEFNIFPAAEEIRQALQRVRILELSVHAQWQTEFFDKQGAIEFSAYKNLENAERELIQFIASCGFELKRDDSNGLIYHGYNNSFKKEDT